MEFGSGRCSLSLGGGSGFSCRYVVTSRLYHPLLTGRGAHYDAKVHPEIVAAICKKNPTSKLNRERRKVTVAQAACAMADGEPIRSSVPREKSLSDYVKMCAWDLRVEDIPDLSIRLPALDTSSSPRPQPTPSTSSRPSTPRTPRTSRMGPACAPATTSRVPSTAGPRRWLAKSNRTSKLDAKLPSASEDEVGPLVTRFRALGGVEPLVLRPVRARRWSIMRLGLQGGSFGSTSSSTNCSKKRRKVSQQESSRR